jgi:hypothetical protein
MCPREVPNGIRQELVMRLLPIPQKYCGKFTLIAEAGRPQRANGLFLMMRSYIHQEYAGVNLPQLSIRCVM